MTNSDPITNGIYDDHDSPRFKNVCIGGICIMPIKSNIAKNNIANDTPLINILFSEQPVYMLSVNDDMLILLWIRYIFIKILKIDFYYLIYIKYDYL